MDGHGVILHLPMEGCQQGKGMASPNVFSRKSLFTVTQLVGALAGIGLAKAFGFGGLIPLVAAALVFGAVVGLVISRLEANPRAQLVVSSALLLVCFCTALVFRNFQPSVTLSQPATTTAAAPAGNTFTPDTSSLAALAPAETTPIFYDALDPQNPKNGGHVPPASFEEHPKISVAGSTEWNNSVAIFMAQNPSTLNANNRVIFDEKLAENASKMMTDIDRLRTAYFVASVDPRWERHWSGKQ